MNYRKELVRRGIPDPEAGGRRVLGWVLIGAIVMAAVLIIYPPRSTRCFNSIDAFLKEYPNSKQWFQNGLRTGCPDEEVSITFRRWG
ncbi:hypothetical protein K2Q00_01230 [Patescibacteria group bacterium]|nr:hypothetical protein [Patescibacteria group bacterium]